MEGGAEGSLVDTLPIELLVEVFIYCVDLPVDVLPIALVCRKWKETIFGAPSNRLWERLAKLDYPYLKFAKIKMRNWLILYRARRKSAWLVKRAERRNLDPIFFVPIENCGLTKCRKTRAVSENESEKAENEEKNAEKDCEEEEWDELELDCPMVLGNLTCVVPKANDKYAVYRSHECQVCRCVVRVVYTEKEMTEASKSGDPIAWATSKRERLVPVEVTAKLRAKYYGPIKFNQKPRPMKRPFDSHEFWMPPKLPDHLKQDQVKSRIAARMEKQKQDLLDACKGDK